MRLKNSEALNEGDYAKIGQSISTSETTFVHGYKLQDKNLANLMLCDCPGFEDSRGEVYDLSTMLSIDQTLKVAHSIKAIVLTIAYEDFWGARCRSVMKLFENIKEKIPDVFVNKDIRKSIFLLVTKYNKNEPLEKNLKLAVNDALTDERNMLRNLEGKDTHEDDVQIKITKEKIEIWNFILETINSNRIIAIDIRDKAQRKECLGNFLNAPGVDKRYFAKAMENDAIQRSFSKYITMHVDTWKKHILDKYAAKLPQKINELNAKAKSIEVQIVETKQKNEGLEKAQIIKRNEIDKILATNKRLEGLLSSKDDKLIAEEIKNHDVIREGAVNINQITLKQLAQDILENQKRVNENKFNIQRIKQENVCLQKQEYRLKQENESFANGNTQIVLGKYTQHSPDEEMTLITMTEENARERAKCFNSVTEHKAEGIEKTYKAGSYTGTLVHDILIEKDYYIVPKGVTSFDDLRTKLYDKDFFQGSLKYKAMIEGEGWDFDFGVKAHPDRKKMVYAIRTTWKAGGTIPWFRITHDLPNIDINEATIINNDAELKSLNKAVLENSKEIDRLVEKNDDLEKEIAAKGKNKQKLEEEGKRNQTHYRQIQLQDVINKNKEFIVAHEQGIERDKEEIKSNLNIIASDNNTLKEAQAMLYETKLQKLHLAIIIKAKLGVAELLRKFATLSTEGLGIQKENADQTLVFDLQEYAKYYDKYIVTILGMCEKDLNTNMFHSEENFISVPIIGAEQVVRDPMMLSQYNQSSKAEMQQQAQGTLVNRLVSKGTEIAELGVQALRAKWEARAKNSMG